MHLADKMDMFSSSIFVVMAEAKAKKAAEGVRVIDLGVGTPDTPPAPHIVAAMRDALDNPENHKYAITDNDSLLHTVQGWYATRYDVALSTREICGLVGSQDGLAHLPLALLNPGDVALVPNPGYPMFRTGPGLASAELYEYPLLPERGYLPDLDAIPPDVAHRARMMTISYPANPLGRLAPPGFFEKVVQFAKKYDIVILHDNAYSELTFDGQVGGSFLSAPGALDVGIEFNSLSKSHNLSGARISFALGRQDVIAALNRLKSNIDYGIFRPVQEAAVAALTGPQDCVRAVRALYEKRRNVLCSALGVIGWEVRRCEGTMFQWAKLPKGYTDSMDFCLKMMAAEGVGLVPGISFGSLGEGYVRFGLVQSEDDIRAAVSRIGHYLQMPNRLL